MDNENIVLVSVVIPCYNNGNYLIEMIDCFKRQTVLYWELIIVDDGSTDYTPALVCEYIKSVPQIHFYQREREPKNGDTCRNIGFEKSTGKYIIFMDADDLIADTLIQHRVEFMESHSDLDYASFPAKEFSDSNNIPVYNPIGLNFGDGHGSNDLLYGFLMGENYPFSIWNNIYKRTSIERLFWDENLYVYQDFDYAVRGILLGLKHKFSGSDDADYYYRRDINNKIAVTSNFVSNSKCNSTIYLFTRILDLFVENNLSSRYKRAFFIFVLIHYFRLISGADIYDIKKYINWCSKNYHCGLRMSMMRKIDKIQNPFLQLRVFRLVCFLFFGRIYFLKPFIKRKFNISCWFDYQYIFL